MSHPIRILMLEDSPYDAELNERMLKQGGLELVIRRTETEVSFLNALHHFNPDIVLSDYNLPVYNGLKALQATRAFDPHIPFIFVTGAIGEEASVSMLKQGAVDYILKDRLMRLPEAVNRALEDARQKRKLRATEERFRLLMESSEYGIWDWDLRADKLYLSPQWKQQLGYQDDELENTLETFGRLLHPDDRDRILAKIDQFNECPGTWDIEFRMCHKSGQERWINSRGSYQLDADGKIKRVLGVHIDVTERVKSEEKLRQTAQVFSSTIEGVLITDIDGTILEVNPAFSEITGYSREESLGRNPRMYQSGRHNRDFYRSLWDSLVNEGQWSGEIWNRRSDGYIYPTSTTISAIKDENGKPTGYVGLFADITQSKRTEARLEFLAHHDPLTGLPNRLLFSARLKQALKHAKRNNRRVAVIFIDLDFFKNINDSLGHPVGDELLHRVSHRLLQFIRADDTLARLSGDEFVLMIEDVVSLDSLTLVLEKIMNSFGDPFTLKRHQIQVSASIGVSVFPDDGLNNDELLRNADAAMYRAKDEGRNNYQFYTREMTESALEHIFLDHAIHNALSQQEFLQFYQPQYRLEDNRLIGCETLIRWQHPLQGMIAPQRFIPLAERNGAIREIDTWMLKTACRQGRMWLDRQLPLQRISVNMTGSHIQRDNFANSIKAVLADENFPRQHLEIEVTESFVMQRPDAGIRQLQKLYDDGISIAIDDFGTGYSSLNYLKKLPVSKIKLDRSFIQDITEDKDSLAIVKAIIDLSKSLGKTIIAEGVETSEQADLLRDLGCEQVQGFYFERPVNVEKMTELLVTQYP